MKGLALFVVCAICLTCFFVAANNQAMNTDNVPMSFSDVLETLRALSALSEDQLTALYKSFEYWGELFSGQLTIESLIKDLDSIEGIDDLLKIIFRYDFNINANVSFSYLLLFVFYTLLEGVHTVFSFFELIYCFFVGVPRPVE